ncbi:reverse transcriptase [Lasius niger]|uniref:Reverse transcriptase n=1 Tax=Lasius niger TaxID=67767 RepID=A0A0J7JZE0_LASNI|nr:reverse transcriptase [Lasius niger]
MARSLRTAKYSTCTGEYTKMAVVPRLEIWMIRDHGSMSFYSTQLMTGPLRDKLRRLIRAAWARSWGELLISLDRDPWRRPYKMVLGKLKQRASPMTETLDSLFVQRVIDTLFPVMEDGLNDSIPEREIEWDEEEHHVSRGELRDVVRRIKSGKAPGPDGVSGKAWSLAHRELHEELRDVYTICLREGKFPPAWKRANIVLLPKEGKARDQPSAYRSICLLDEAGKIFERIICDRLVWHLSREGPNLNQDQYGFRVGRSTIDAIGRVRSIAGSVAEEGGVTLAISLDIKNAFNTLP